MREGPHGLLRGAGVSALRDAPYAGIYMSAYQSFKRVGASVSPTAHTAVNTVSAASAAAVAGLVTHPFDVLKVRRPTSLTVPASLGSDCPLPDANTGARRGAVPHHPRCGHAHLEGSGAPYDVLARVFADPVMQTAGVRGFYDGLSLRFGRKVASSTIAWVVYEAILERWQ